tara:strand:+ start:207 stop:467 length:261 start_codon:yes stop_codon:yes gene_type:complete
MVGYVLIANVSSATSATRMLLNGGIHPTMIVRFGALIVYLAPSVVVGGQLKLKPPDLKILIVTLVLSTLLQLNAPNAVALEKGSKK